MRDLWESHLAAHSHADTWRPRLRIAAKVVAAQVAGEVPGPNTARWPLARQILFDQIFIDQIADLVCLDGTTGPNSTDDDLINRVRQCFDAMAGPYQAPSPPPPPPA